MGLINALNIATSGLRTVQGGLNAVANNVAQADVEGYKRQDLRPEGLAVTGGVRAIIVRASDRFLEQQVRTETTRAAEFSVKDNFLSRVDSLFGVPGDAGSLDGLLNGFNSSLQQLSNSPDDFISRQGAVEAAGNLATGLNDLSAGVQNLRQLAEDSIATTVSDINESLQRLENINERASGIDVANSAFSELMTERDRQLSRLSEAMEIRVTERDNGTISIRTKSGNSLLEGTAAQFEFDQRGNLTAGTLYSPDENERAVGTVTFRSSNGYELDLINNGILDTGRLGALINMRDNILVETQAQLDEMAAGLATSLSDIRLEGQAVTSGASSGFQVDLASLQQGNSISLAYQEGGASKNVTLIRVDDPALLPLSDDQTAKNGDRVIGIDFSSGFAAAAGSINAALGPAISAVATAGGLAFLDDGADATTQITGLSSQQTPVELQNKGSGLALFVDGRDEQKVYSGALEGRDQKVGFASRLAVNNAVVDNNELLVRYSNSPQTAIGDTTRPLAILDRLNKSELTFSPKAGIGSGSAPYKGSILDYSRQVIADQTGKAARAAQENRSQGIVLESVEQRLSSETGVEIDEELGKLIALQNSYAANARILQAVDEMMQRLLSI